MKISNDNIGNRTRDLPAISAVPQRSALPRAPPRKLCTELKYLELKKRLNSFKLFTYRISAIVILGCNSEQYPYLTL